MSLVERVRSSGICFGKHNRFWTTNLKNYDVADRKIIARPRSDYLSRLEAESIFIIREAVSEAENPVLLYSVGKDSSVLLHLARKAFYPAKAPLPLLHVDTRWKFREMYRFRDHAAQASGMDLIIHVNPDAIEQDINPFDHGAVHHTRITKTEGLKQALDNHRFDVVLGGARRDEERSRAKERIFSFRTDKHVWNPRNQRPELWSLYNGRKARGESMRVFPLSNWTELDIWQYIHEENIPLVSLYFAKERPVVVRDGLILVVDDGRMRLSPAETISMQTVRFRTLGCYPLTGAISSNAANVKDVIVELLSERHSERQGRLVDAGATANMEKCKTEGYF
ncbi:sulfate adenylyltransferase subunit CysD (plasmid) [Rhizobium sp. 007]|nr:sulfate adenylyltransferase subunit CysD [Rhizobium sp. 007]